MLEDDSFYFFLACISVSWKSSYPLKKILADKDISHLCYKKNNPPIWVAFNNCSFFNQAKCWKLRFLWFFSIQFKILGWRSAPYLGHNVLTAEWKSKYMGKKAQRASSFCHTSLLPTCPLVVGKARHMAKTNFWSPQEAQSHNNEWVRIFLLEDIMIMGYNNTITRIYNYSILGELLDRVNWTDQNRNLNKICVYIFYA